MEITKSKRQHDHGAGCTGSTRALSPSANGSAGAELHSVRLSALPLSFEFEDGEVGFEMRRAFLHLEMFFQTGMNDSLVRAARSLLNAWTRGVFLEYAKQDEGEGAA